MDTTLTPSEMMQSRLSDMADANTQQNQLQNISIARMQSDEQHSRAWRITFGRVERQDGQGLNNGVFPSIPAWIAQDYQYTAGILATQIVPPRRSNPVWGMNTPGSNGVLPLFAQVAWGVAGGQSRHHLLGNWPMQGGSLVVYGTSVEVWGGAFVTVNNTIDPRTAPRLTASIVPLDGAISQDSGELSLCQNVIVANLANIAPPQAGITTDGVANPTRGFNSPAGLGSALPISAVFNVGPFQGWAAQIRSLSLSVVQPRLIIEVTNLGIRAQQFELRDNQAPDGAGGWVPSPGDVGIIYSTPLGVGAQTVGQLESLINSTSRLMFVSSPSPNQAFFVDSQWTAAAGYAPTDVGIGTAQAIGATQGGQLYVPDFARRVCVQILKGNDNFTNQDVRVPLTGTLPTQLNWYDDQGNVVFAEFQATLAAQSTVWRPVPAPAVMLGIYGPTVVEPAVAQVHWRIAP